MTDEDSHNEDNSEENQLPNTQHTNGFEYFPVVE